MVNTRAIVLTRKDYKDHHSLVCFYSLDFGKINLIARGTKKSTSKLIGHLEPLNLVNLMIIKGRERDYVGSVISENSFLNIKSDYDLINISGQAVRFLLDLTYENGVDYDIFLLLKDFLSSLDNLKKGDFLAQFYLTCFQLKLLRLLGYDFDFSLCSSCGKAEASFFDYYNKEVLCSDCVSTSPFLRDNSIKLSPAVLAWKDKILSSAKIGFSGLKISQSQKKDLDKFIETIRKTVF